MPKKCTLGAQRLRIARNEDGILDDRKGNRR